MTRTPPLPDPERFHPYDLDRPLLMHCRCGRPHAEGICEPVSAPAADAAGQPTDFIEAALVKALLPHEGQRRRFLAAVGSQAARAAIASVLPVSALQAMAQDKAPLEKKELQIGFIAITCATPLIMAHPMGFYQQQGLRVQLNKTAGWALIRDKIISGEHDASHFLSPMPLAMSMGVGSARLPVSVATIQNVNGQAITLHVKHKDKRDPRQWKGMKFAVPFEYSMHNFLLRYYVAEHGLDPDRDLQIRVTPPPEMVANLRAGNIDGFLGPDPFNQRAVYDGAGFIHLLSKDIWDGHPCCAFGLSEDFIRQHPNTFAALYRAVLKSAQMARDPAQREEIARAIAPAAYLNQPEVVIKQVLTGRFADGLGNVRHVPDRTDFDPVPWQAMAVWILTQMKRWGYLKGEVNYRQIAEKVFLLTDARRQMKLLEQTDPGERGRTITVMGRGFDPARAQEYEKSFAIRKAAV